MNLLINGPVTLDMLTRCGHFVHPIQLPQIGYQSFYLQVSELALKALKTCTS